MTAAPKEVAGEIELGTLPTERLEARLCQWAAMLAAADFHFLEMIAEFDRRKGWKSWGLSSCADWLASACAISPATARERVRVARSLEGLPLTSELFRAGKLSYSKVRAITRVATIDTEPELLQLAEAATAGQLEEIVRAWRKCLDVHDLSRHERQRKNRYVDYGYDDDGSLVGRFSIPADEAPLFVKGLKRFSAPPPTRAERADVSAETSTVRQREADALVAMADAALGSEERPPDEKTMVVVEVEQEFVSADTDGMCQTASGRVALAAEIARRLACEAQEMIVLVDNDGDEVGRTKPSRTIPRRIRRALSRRDHDQCRFPGCTRTGRVEAHHLLHRAHGGTNELPNLVTLCSHHHHLVHEGGFQLGTHDNGSTFEALAPDGRVITETSLRSLRDEPTEPLEDHIGVPTAPDTLMAGSGERMCRDSMLFAVGAAVAYHHRRGTSTP